MKIAFLHEDSERETFMYKPEGFEVDGNEHMVYMLKKSLYDLKQAHTQWYKKFDLFMMRTAIRGQKLIIVYTFVKIS